MRDFEPKTDPTEIPDIVERYEDMSPTGRLRVMRQPDGDIIVTVVPDGELAERDMLQMVSAEFCTSGGASRRTREALAELMRAMHEDNQEAHGSHRRGKDFGKAQ